MRALALAGTALAFWSCAEPTRTRAESAETRADMAVIADALHELIPLALSDARFGDPANEDAIEASLRTLAAGASGLERHGRTRETSFGYLSRSLAGDSAEALARFDRGERPQARFMVQQLIEECVACHTRLPSPGSSDVGLRLFSGVDYQPLSLAERARLQVATRQFDAALDSYELLFAEASLGAGGVTLQRALTEYLIVCVRVQEDLVRPRGPLGTLALRPEVPRYLVRDLRGWVQALGELERRPRIGSPLQQARELHAEAQRLSQFPADRAGLVHELVASSILHRFASHQRSPSPELAEAYFLLGVTETRIHRAWWQSEADLYLETAIRMAPDSPFADDAYALLEQEILAGWSGSAGLGPPLEVQSRLDELRALVETR